MTSWMRAAAKLRMERDSVPEELDEITRKLKQLEIEREAIKRENDTDKIAQLDKGHCRTPRPGKLVPRKVGEREGTRQQDSAGQAAD